MTRPLLCGFLKIRNGFLREGDILRVLANLDRICDTWVICDDASNDGTREHLIAWVAERPNARLILVPPAEQDFSYELKWKQRMMDAVHELQPQWILWLDGDEVVDRAGTEGLVDFVTNPETAKGPYAAYQFEYVQLWRNTAWERVDSLFKSSFIKLWRYRPDFDFDVTPGTHRDQFPRQLVGAPIGTAPFKIIHYGNAGKNLTWKFLQYYGGLADLSRHHAEGNTIYEKVDRDTLPPGAEWFPGPRPKPMPHGSKEYQLIAAMAGLRALPRTFCVVIPTHNRAHTLNRALTSVMAQTYERFIVLVLDDGSTDDTPKLMRQWQDADPRIFYCRYPENRGTVAVHELALSMAIEMTEWWSRLGSDDWWNPHKLEVDAKALEAGAQIVYGPYTAYHPDGRIEGHFNPPMAAVDIKARLLSGDFVCSWANMAMRTDVLKAIKDRHGRFGADGLRYMEDFLIWSRAARFVPFTYRRSVDDIEAGWSIGSDGASARVNEVMEENTLTRQIIFKENAAWGR